MRMLAALGITEPAEQVYRSVVEDGAGSVELLAARLGLDAADADGAVAQLVAAGLVVDRDGRLQAVPPSGALERRADELSRQARAAVESARTLSSWWSRNSTSVGYAEFLRSGDACRAAELQVLDQARTSVRSLTTVPTVDPGSGPGPDSGSDPVVVPSKLPPPQITQRLHEGIGRGVEFRGVYTDTMLRDDASRSAVLDRMAAGEQVRTFAGLPVSLTIADEELAVIAYPASRRDEFHSLLVRPSGLLDLLVSTFETFWRLGTPLRPREPGPTTDLAPEEKRLLLYLMSGITDAAIARELGLSQRTVTRRVGRLQERLGVRTRFQLGAQAATRDWL